MPYLEQDKDSLKHFFNQIFMNKDEKNYSELLEGVKDGKKFFFAHNKNIFSLGSQKNTNFFIESDELNGKHCIFLKDIIGITIIPMPNCMVKINEQPINKSAKLQHGNFITFGNDLNYIFKQINKEDSAVEQIDKKFKKSFIKKQKKLPKEGSMHTKKQILAVFYMAMIASFLLFSFLII